MSLHINAKHIRCFADRIFKWLVIIDLDELPFDKVLDSSLVHGSEVQAPHQLTVNYKIKAEQDAGTVSVPFYSGVGPANLGQMSLQCILKAEKMLVIKNGHYRAV